MTLKEMKALILANHHLIRPSGSSNWGEQSGPEDYRGWADDQNTMSAVRSARTWNDLIDAAPRGWGEAVTNKCAPWQL